MPCQLSRRKLSPRYVQTYDKRSPAPFVLFCKDQIQRSRSTGDIKCQGTTTTTGIKTKRVFGARERLRQGLNLRVSIVILEQGQKPRRKMDENLNSTLLLMLAPKGQNQSCDPSTSNKATPSLLPLEVNTSTQTSPVPDDADAEIPSLLALTIDATEKIVEVAEKQVQTSPSLLLPIKKRRLRPEISPPSPDAESSQWLVNAQRSYPFHYSPKSQGDDGEEYDNEDPRSVVYKEFLEKFYPGAQKNKLGLINPHQNSNLAPKLPPWVDTEALKEFAVDKSHD